MDQLSTGSIKALHSGDKSNPLHKNPSVQIINLKAVNIQSGERYRIIISDGKHFMQALLSSQHSFYVTEELIKRNSIILLKEFACNSIQNRKILIIIDFDIIQKNVENKIGFPLSLEGSNFSSNYTAQSSNVPLTLRPEYVPDSQLLSVPNHNSACFTENSATPIRSLNPYQTKWHIKARVTQKAPIKKWHNARGEGQLFSCNFLDRSGEIKATAFNDQASHLYNVIEEGHVYFVSKARVIMAKKQFSTLDNEYELQFERSTTVEACNEDSGIPQINYDFVNIVNLENYQKDTNIDFIGVVIDDHGISEIIAKASGKPIKKRDLDVVDNSLQGVKVTVWGSLTDELDFSNNPVIVCKGARVNDFNGRSLTVGNNTSLKLNPNIPKAHELRKWYQETGKNERFNYFQNSSIGEGDTMSLCKKLSLKKVKAEGLGTKGKTNYFIFRGTVVFIKADNPAYPACPDCKKKVTLADDNRWRCEKCQKNYPQPNYRYILTASVDDETSQIYISGFDDFGKALLKMDANDFMRLKEENSSAAMQVINKALYQTYNFKIRAREESYNDVQRIKYNSLEANEIDYIEESQDLINEIEKLTLL